MKKLNVGDKLVCINNFGVEVHFTIGNVYSIVDIVDERDLGYCIYCRGNIGVLRFKMDEVSIFFKDLRLLRREKLERLSSIVNGKKL